MPDVREKLVELQRSALEYLSDACSGHDCEECPYNEYGRNCDFVVRAEYLIANGVTIQRYGRWISHNKGQNNWVECSVCNTVGSPFWKCCPVCETKMAQPPKGDD